MCRSEVPTIVIDFALPGFPSLAGVTGTLTMSDVNGNVVSTQPLVYQPGGHVELLYPGTTVNPDGSIADVPGWNLTNAGLWVRDPADEFLRDGHPADLHRQPDGHVADHLPAGVERLRQPREPARDAASAPWSAACGASGLARRTAAPDRQRHLDGRCSGARARCRCHTVSGRTTQEGSGLMNITTLELPVEEATRRLAEYSEQLAAERTVEDEAILAGYRAAARGLPVIMLSEVFNAGGWFDNGLPRLAIARADATEVRVEVERPWSSNGNVDLVFLDNDRATNRGALIAKHTVRVNRIAGRPTPGGQMRTRLPARLCR